MDRKEFLKSICKYGMCSCAGITMMVQGEASAQEGDTEAHSNDTKKIRELQGNIEFMHKRFARLIELMTENVDVKTRNHILEAMGRNCTTELKKFLETYKNDLKGYLDEIQKRWMERVEVSGDGKTIRMYGKKMGECVCPLVESKLTPVEFCNCSAGWQKEAFEIVTGKSVEVKINESILRGGDRCSFTVKKV